MRDVATLLLLGYGAGVRSVEKGLVVERDFSIFVRGKLRAEADALLDSLVAKIAKEPQLECDCVTLFEERAASTEFGQLLAGKLSLLWQRSMSLLVIGRKRGGQLTLTHYRFGDGNPPRTTKRDMGRLSGDEAKQLLAGQRMLAFSDALHGVRHEGIIRMLLHRPTIRRTGVKLVGLAALAIIHCGARKRIRGMTAGKRLRVVFIEHLGYPGTKIPKDPMAWRDRFAEKVSEIVGGNSRSKPKTG